MHWSKAYDWYAYDGFSLEQIKFIILNWSIDQT